MDTWEKEKFGKGERVELRCSSTACWKCHGDVCEARFEDLIFGVGP